MGGSSDVRLQVKPYRRGRHSSHAVPLKPPLQRHSPVPEYPSSQEPRPLHGVSGPPGQAERKENWFLSSGACLFAVTVGSLVFCKNRRAGSACKCLSPEVCKSACDTWDYCEPCALNSLIHFHSSHQKGVRILPALTCGCCYLVAYLFRPICEWHFPNQAFLECLHGSMCCQGVPTCMGSAFVSL